MRRLAWVLGVNLHMLGAPLPAWAQASAVQVWYRSSEGCPDGALFIARLAELGRPAQLARAGDRVDFVVTLGPAALEGEHEPASVGRLERQTERGTVAIRELRAARCEDVSEALALSLELALQPVVEGSHSARAGPELESSMRPSPPEPAVSERQPPPGSGSAREPQAGLAPVENAPGSDLGVSVGAQATLNAGVAPALLPGLSVFVGIGGAGNSARLGLRAGYRESEAGPEQTDLHVALLAGRLEGCPWSWVSGAFSVEPCAALDLGVLRAESPGAEGRSDSGFWLSGAAHGRATWRIVRSLSLEAELGASVPFVRYEFGSDAASTSVFRTEPVGLAAALGAAWRVP